VKQSTDPLDLGGLAVPEAPDELLSGTSER